MVAMSLQWRDELTESANGHRFRNNPHEFGGVTPLAGDITEEAVRSTIRSTIETDHGGKLDLLVNNAGIGGIGKFADASSRSDCVRSWKSISSPQSN